MRRAAALLLFLLAAGAGPVRGQSPAAPAEPRPPDSVEAVPAAVGKTVTGVSYSADGPVDAVEISRLVEVKVGQPLSDKATAATIRNLFATGRFSDVQIEAVPGDSGIAVVVRLVRA